MRDLLVKLAPDAVPLVDAFDWHDRQLKSAIGRYDGNVYEALMDSAQRNPVNTEVSRNTVIYTDIL